MRARVGAREAFYIRASTVNSIIEEDEFSARSIAKGNRTLTGAIIARSQSQSHKFFK